MLRSLMFTTFVVLTACGQITNGTDTQISTGPQTSPKVTAQNIYDSMTATEEAVSLSNNSSGVTYQKQNNTKICRKTPSGSTYAYACWNQFSLGATAQSQFLAMGGISYSVSSVNNYYGGSSVEERQNGTGTICQKTVGVYYGASPTYACFQPYVTL